MPIGITTGTLIAAGVGAAGAIGGSLIASSGAKSAAKTQSNAATSAAQLQTDAANHAADVQAKAAADATGLQRDIYNQNRSDLAPWRAAGQGALSMLADASGINGPEGYSRSQSQFQTSPGYGFAFDQGTRAVNSNMAARGMLRSGASLKALTQFGQGTANTEYGNYMNRLSTLAGYGQTANAYGQQAGQSFATNAGNTMQDAAAARASGYIGGANAGASGIIGAANAGAAGSIGASNAWGGGLSSLARLAGTYINPNSGGSGNYGAMDPNGFGAPGSWSPYGYAY